MRCDVVIVHWNTPEALSECVDSVAAHGGARVASVTVVDNASEPAAARVAEEAARRALPDIRWIGNDANEGFARGANRGAREGDAPVVLFLNPDAVLDAGAVDALVAPFESDPAVSVTGANLLDPDGTPQNAIAAAPTLATELLGRSLLHRLAPGRYPGKTRTYPEPIAVESVIGAGMAVRRETFDRLGGLDEGFFLFLEETDLCVRARAAGGKVLFVPAAPIRHRQGASKNRARRRARVEFFRARYRYFRIHHGGGRTAVLATGLVVKLALDALANGIGTLLTLGTLGAFRRRGVESVHLLLWHAAGCPASAGLAPPARRAERTRKEIGSHA